MTVSEESELKIAISYPFIISRGWMYWLNNKYPYFSFFATQGKADKLHDKSCFDTFIKVKARGFQVPKHPGQF